jgi:hypothetical protein
MGKIIRRDIDRWFKEKEEKKIKVEWIPVHMGMRGNEAK